MRCRSIGVAIAITVAVFGPAAVAGRPDGFGGRVRGHVEALAALGSRMGGGANEARAAEYIAGEFRRLGLPAAIETFAFESFEPSSIELRVGDRTIDPVGLGLDPYAGDPGYAGTFVLLDPRIPGSEYFWFK